MFAKTVIDSDAFLDMPLSAQALYFHLSMRADDEGFINNPKKIQRMVGCSDDDAKLLVMKSFIIPFDSGVVVVKHWRIHNYIQRDRYKPTVYADERAQLSVKSNGAYTKLNQDVSILDTGCIQSVSILDTQDRIGKDSVSIVKRYSANDALNDAITSFIDFRKKLKAPMTDRAINLLIGKLNCITADENEQIKILDQSILNGWKSVYPLKTEAKDLKKMTSVSHEEMAVLIDKYVK